uniref:Putative secreted protein n=1 Tax=Anopheles darlingi TaxID=43151 RepID=A0A2M4DCG1_ANODA
MRACAVACVTLVGLHYIPSHRSLRFWSVLQPGSARSFHESPSPFSQSPDRSSRDSVDSRFVSKVSLSILALSPQRLHPMTPGVEVICTEDYDAVTHSCDRVIYF